jgi:hypothetical protein
MSRSVLHAFPLAGVVISFGGAVMTTTVPPPRYDHPYHGRLVEHVLPPSEVYAHCGAVSCAFPASRGRPCVIYLPRRHPAFAYLRRHEIGNCNGWGDGPGARQVTIPLGPGWSPRPGN